MRTTLLLTLLIAAFFVADVTRVYAQPDRRPDQERLKKKIGDLRKVKLLDLLDLQGEQVETFFAVYNTYEDKIVKAKEEIDEASRELQGTIGNNGTSSELQKLTKDLRRKIRDMGTLIEERFDAAQKVLTTEQYAQYVVFESRFRDELQRMILDRMRRGKRR